VSAPILFALGEHQEFARRLAVRLDAEFGALEVRRFPDGETYLRYRTPCEGRAAILVCTLDRPDEKFAPLIFAAEAARNLGAAAVGLVSPYLAYMRQDRRFETGEAVTSTYFARAISTVFDWLVTVDPHLHRHASLNEIYTIPTRTAHAAPLIADWVKTEVDRPIFIGPDAESAQWVGAVADGAGAPCVVLEKLRRGDREVEISVPNIGRWLDSTPVLVDDVISTGRTMIETIGRLVRAGMRGPVCIAVHGVFAGSAYRDLLAAGASRVATTNTIPHESNRIDVCELISGAVGAVLAEISGPRDR